MFPKIIPFKAHQDSKLLLGFYAILALILLFALNPQSSVDAVFYFSYLGLLSVYFYKIFILQLSNRNNVKMFKLAFLIFISCTALLIFHESLKYFVPAIASLLLTTSSLFLCNFPLQNYKKVMVVLLVAIFLLTSVANSSSLRKEISKEPAPETYSSDHLAYLRIYYLVGKGYNYYSALKKTHIEDARSDTFPNQPLAWRTPEYILIWKIIPINNGLVIYFEYLLLISSLLFFTFKLANIYLDENSALLVPFSIFPYFHFSARQIVFLDQEWWALSFFVIGLYFMLKNKKIISVLLLSLAALTRELFIIHLVSIALLTLIAQKFRYAFILISAIMTFVILIALHYIKVLENINGNLVWFTQSRELSHLLLIKTLSYGSIDYLSYRFRPFLLALLVLPILIVYLFLKRKLQLPYLILIASFAPFIVVILKAGTYFNDYWGVAYIPLMLSTFTILIIRSLNVIFAGADARNKDSEA